MNTNLNIYCVTNKRVEHLEKTQLKLISVGKEKSSKLLSKM